VLILVGTHTRGRIPERRIESERASLAHFLCGEEELSKEKGKEEEEEHQYQDGVIPLAHDDDLRVIDEPPGPAHQAISLLQPSLKILVSPKLENGSILAQRRQTRADKRRIPGQ